MTLSDLILKHGRVEALRLIDEKQKAEDIEMGQEYRDKTARLYPNQEFPTLPHYIKRHLLTIERKEEELNDWIWKRKNNDYILA